MLCGCYFHCHLHAQVPRDAFEWNTTPGQPSVYACHAYHTMSEGPFYRFWRNLQFYPGICIFIIVINLQSAILRYRYKHPSVLFIKAIKKVQRGSGQDFEKCQDLCSDRSRLNN